MNDKKILKWGMVKQSGTYTLPTEQFNINKMKNIAKNHLIIVLKLLLKWQHQPEQQSRKIKASISEHRYHLQQDLDFSPRLKNHLSEIWLESYQEARIQAADETDLSEEIFPEKSPYTIEKILNTDYLP